MENYESFGGRISILWFSVGFMLLLGYAKAENMSDPLKNVNLAPYWQWRSAYECMLPQYNSNSTRCSSKDYITFHGLVTVTSDEISDYCKPDGCVKYVREVLKCINSAKRDFWFANHGTVKFVNDSINQGCKTYTAINTTTYTGSGMKVYQNMFMSLIISISTVVFTTIIDM